MNLRTMFLSIQEVASYAPHGSFHDIVTMHVERQAFIGKVLRERAHVRKLEPARHSNRADRRTMRFVNETINPAYVKTGSVLLCG